MATDFRELLSTPMDTIEKPKPWPPGTYYGTVLKHEFGESSQRRTPFVRFHLRVDSAGDDVDQDGLQECLAVKGAGGEVTGSKPITERAWRREYYLTSDAMFRCKDFLSSMGIPTEGRALGECIPEAQNGRVLMTITQRNSEDGTTIFNDVSDLRGVED